MRASTRCARFIHSFFCVCLCLVLLSACGPKQQAMPQMPPPEVAVITVTPQPVTLTTELPGRTTAHLVAEVRPQVSGIIQKRFFEEGAAVSAGQVLYQIDPAPFQAAYDSAAASLGRAQANLPALQARARRYDELVGDKAVSKQDVDDISASIKQAQADITYWKAAVDAARINLDYTRVKASISGRIGKSAVTRGALVTAGQPAPLATIQQFNPIYVDVPQSTAQLLRLKKSMESGSLRQDGAGQRAVKLILEDGSVYGQEGELQFRDITVERSSGTVVLRMIFPNPDEALLPGMYVRAVVQEGVNPQAVLIPQPAVMRDPKGNPYVMLVNSAGMAEQRPVVIDRALGNQWLIGSGLKPAERVIVEGLLKVRPGAPVKAVAAGAPAPAAPSAQAAPSAAAAH